MMAGERGMLRFRSRSGAALRAAAIATCAVVVAAPAVAVAAEERTVVFSLALNESPLDRCGGLKSLEGAVEERLRRVVFTGEDSSDITFAIAAERGDGTDASWRAQIVERNRAGEALGRRDVPLPLADCSKALDTLAVVLAIMIGPPRMTTDPPRRAEPAEPPPSNDVSPSPSPPESAADRPSPPTARPSPSHPSPELRWSASPLAGVTGGTGVLPGVAWGIEAGVLVHPPIHRLSAIARATYWPGQATPTRPPAEVNRIGAALLGCYELIRATASATPLTWTACAGGDVSRIEAESSGLTTARKSSLSAALLGEIRIGYRSPVPGNVVVEPFLAVQASAVVRRDRFTYRDAAGRERTLLQPAPGAVQGTFGVAVHFL